jgi:hypothetical protein
LKSENEKWKEGKRRTKRKERREGKWKLKMNGKIRMLFISS